MKSTFGGLGRIACVVALSGGALGLTGCGEDGTDVLPGAETVCPGLACASTGLAEGNASISGVAAIDGFFGSVVKFQSVADNVSGSLAADLADIQAGFGITDADLTASGSLGAAIKGKLDASLEGGLQVVAEPARCAVDARLTVDAQAQCEVEAGCTAMATPGSVEVECQGSCEADASVMATCTGGATLTCSASAPSVVCNGQCNGTCTLAADAAATCTGACAGTCNGTCSGECSAEDAEGNCVGTCSGTCTGSCDAECTLEATLTAECDGTCSGECTYEPGEAGCEASATARCEAEASATVMCSGKCDGEVVPPMVSATCDASAACQAQARADASLDVQCTPPSVRIDYTFKADVDASVRADLAFGINRLRAKLPSLLVSLRKGSLVLEAGASLVADASAVIPGVATTLISGDADFVAVYKLGACVPSELEAVGAVIANASGELTAQTQAAASVQQQIGG